MSSRKKPFSGKKKKKQLQEKRKRKEEDASPVESNIIETKEGSIKIQSQPVLPSSSSSSSSASGRGSNGGRGYNRTVTHGDLRTVFEKEDKSVIEMRTERSRLPINRTPDLHIADTKMYQSIIDFPRRPPWDYSMNKQQLESNEERYFEKWLRDIYTTYPRERLNYFEHNLEVWRQLWRVSEISDVVVILADARHPLFHFPPSLYHYVISILKKPLVLVLNKIDLVTSQHVDRWIDYFSARFPALKVIPFTSHPRLNEDGELINNGFLPREGNFVTKKIRRTKKGIPTHRHRTVVGSTPLIATCAQYYYDSKRARESSDAAPSPSASEDIEKMLLVVDEEGGNADASEGAEISSDEEDADLLRSDSDDDEDDDDNDDDDDRGRKKRGKQSRGKGKVEKLPSLPLESDSPLDTIERFSTDGTEIITIGMLGHPNVGKSSLINGLKKKKVVSTSRTPGHTKHFQTIFMNKWLRLCDCPGLVFPALDMAREMQVVCGLYPLAQIREPYSAVHFLAERIELERIYDLRFPTEEDLINLAKDFDDSQNELLKGSLSKSSAGKGGQGRAPAPKKKTTTVETLSDDEDGPASFSDRAMLTSSSSDPKDTDAFWDNIHQRKTKKKPKPKAKAKDTTNKNQPSDLDQPPSSGSSSSESSVPAEKPKKVEGWSGWAICEAYAIKRCYRTTRGRPDTYRAGQEILRDALDGVVLLCFDPPPLPSAPPAAPLENKSPA